MPTSPRTGFFLLLVIFAATALAGMAVLTRAAWRDSTPEFSSLRTDRLGTSVLFGAYARDGYDVQRGWEAAGAAALDPARTTVFLIAPEAWDAELTANLNEFVRRGGRLILAAAPLPPPPSKTPDAAAALLQPAAPSGLDVQWGARRVALPKDAKIVDTGAAVPARPDLDALPHGVRDMPLLHPATVLQLSGDWTPLFSYLGHPYVAMRRAGAGQIILASEATFLANDEMDAGADPALLAWLVGDRSQVWVDETTHGLGRVRGVPWLLGRYHLAPAVVLLLLGLGLLAWSLGPGVDRPVAGARHADPPPRLSVDGAEGYRRLLQRAVPPGDVLAAVWRQASPRLRKAAAVEPLLRAPCAATDVVARFNAARAALERSESL